MYVGGISSLERRSEQLDTQVQAYGKILSMPVGTYVQKEFCGGCLFGGGWLISKFGILIRG